MDVDTDNPNNGDEEGPTWMVFAFLFFCYVIASWAFQVKETV